jgi:hypothetical protein
MRLDANMKEETPLLLSLIGQACMNESIWSRYNTIVLGWRFLSGIAFLPPLPFQQLVIGANWKAHAGY